MAESVERRDVAVDGECLKIERWVALVFRTGAVCAAAALAASAAVEPFEDRLGAAASDSLRQAALALLLLLPVVRLVATGIDFSARGETRYAVCAGAVLALLALSAGLWL